MRILVEENISNLLKRVFLEMSFPIGEISGLQGVMFKVLVSLNRAVERLFY